MSDSSESMIISETTISFAYKTHTTQNFFIRSDEGLPVKTPALEILYGDQFTSPTQLIKPSYLIISPSTQRHSFYRNLPSLTLTLVAPILFVSSLVWLVVLSTSTAWPVRRSNCCTRPRTVDVKLVICCDCSIFLAINISICCD